jgi:glycosyltransferase involved in cell wall biosynthesis
MPQVSFIIPSYNSLNAIGLTLDSILKQTALSSIRDIIIVDCSDDLKTRKILRAFHEELFKTHRHVENITILLDDKTSPAEARNLGVKRSHGELLCFIDSDVILEPHWLDHVLDAFQTGCLAGSGSVSIPEFQENKPIAPAQLYLQFNESLNAGVKRIIPMVAACNMFVDKKLFLDLGGFPKIRAAEDTLLCLSIRKITPIWFIPGARCFHIFREDFQAYFSNQVMLGKHILIYRRMTYSKWFYKGIWPALLLPGFLLVKFFRMNKRIGAAGSQHTISYLKTSPLFLLGLIGWAAGFLSGCIAND